MRHLTEYDRLYTDMVRRHEKIIFSACFFYATKTVLFDDLRQETLISLYKGYRNFKGTCAEATWVYMGMRLCKKSAVPFCYYDQIVVRCGAISGSWQAKESTQSGLSLTDFIHSMDFSAAFLSSQMPGKISSFQERVA